MKKRIYFLGGLFLFTIASLLYMKFDEPEGLAFGGQHKFYYLQEPSQDLGFDSNDPHFKDKVIADVKASFSEELKPLLDKDNVDEYTMDELLKARKAIGKRDTHLDSLISLFYGTSYGDRRIYIVSGQPTFVGFLLYKKSDGTNVLKK